MNLSLMSGSILIAWVYHQVIWSSTNLGYHLGFNYKRGKFFYWQVGARFNNAVYKLEELGTIADSAEMPFRSED